jgi:prolyl oligopeptidase
MKFLLSATILLSAMMTPVFGQQTSSGRLPYPKTEKVDQSDDYFGTKVNDPYRWLENDTAASVGKWVEAQNLVTNAYLEKIPYRQTIKKRLTEIMNYPRYSSPFRAGDYYIFSKNDGLQNQSVVYVQRGLNGEPKVLIDPNKLSEDGTAAISLTGISKDKKYLSYSLNRAGSDWQEIQVIEIATQRKLDDQLKWVKFSGTAWQGDGFYYSRYPEAVKGKELSNKNEHHKVYYHRLGESQDQDRLVYEDPANPLRLLNAQTTEDERFVILSVSEIGKDGSEVYYQDRKQGNQPFKLLLKGFEYERDVIENVGDQLLVKTNEDAPNNRLILVNPAQPQKVNWKTIVLEKPELLERAATAGGKLFASYLKDVTTRVYQMSLDGKVERTISLPALGTASGFGGNFDDKEVFYSFTSFAFPPTIYKYNIASGVSEVFRKSEVKFNPGDYVTKQVFFTSKDGTRVPMFIVHKKGLKLDGKNPTLLYAYGGFNVSINPAFSPSRLVLLENGGVYASANIRGGSEYGEKWHEAGTQLKKQNVFDDFIAAAEYLIKEKYTSPDKLAMQGGSNGGLLVGAVSNQRPDLFRVALPAVGVMDMLRFQKFTIGYAWTADYGSSDSVKHFKNLYALSPIHNIREGVKYPATLITTADHDDRVVPAHSFKYAATLQEKYQGPNPVLIRIATKAGHGAGKPISKIIEEQADIYSFMFNNLGVIPYRNSKLNVKY